VVLKVKRRRKVSSQKSLEANNKMIKLQEILEGTCGYGVDGQPGDKPAGPHLLKKKKKKRRENMEKLNVFQHERLLKSKKESVNEKKGDFLSSLFPKVKVAKAIKIANKMSGNMTGAVKAIEKFFPGMSKHNDVQDALRKANESDLPTTTKKGKTVKAVHKKSGKEVVYVDTPSVRKKLKRMGFVVKESITAENIKTLKEKMNPEQFHKYMQYVFDTQFNSPEDKIAKKRMIKKINVANKKKGLPLFKESIDESIMINGKKYKPVGDE